jgi:DNA-binding transcriptional MocR family regulator
VELAKRAAERSIVLFPVDRFHHHGAPDPDGVVLGYGSLPEYAFDAALEALGSLLAEALTGTAGGARN